MAKNLKVDCHIFLGPGSTAVGPRGAPAVHPVPAGHGHGTGRLEDRLLQSGWDQGRSYSRQQQCLNTEIDNSYVLYIYVSLYFVKYMNFFNIKSSSYPPF